MTVLVQVAFGIPLRKYTGGLALMQVQGAVVGQVLRTVIVAHPALGARLMRPNGSLAGDVACFLNDEDIRELAGLETAVQPGDRMLLMPAVAGGAA